MFIRAGVAGAIFLLFLIFVNKDTPIVAMGWAVGVALAMIPLGMVLDRFSHKMAMKRWMKKTGRA